MTYAIGGHEPYRPLAGPIMHIGGRTHPFEGNLTRFSQNLQQYRPGQRDERAMADLSEANLLTSEYTGDYRPPWYGRNTPLHRPVLDLDYRAVLLESSTPGHHHLYIDRVMSWDVYSNLLTAMAAANVIEPGYAQASIERGYSAVRLPWMRKS